MVQLVFLLLGVGLLFGSYWRGALIGPGLGSIAVAVYLWPHMAQLN